MYEWIYEQVVYRTFDLQSFIAPPQNEKLLPADVSLCSLSSHIREIHVLTLLVGHKGGQSAACV